MVHVEVEELRVEAGSVVAGVPRRELVVQCVARPERGGGGSVVAHGDGDGLALLGRQHVELDADQLGLALGAAAACVAMVIVSCIDIRSRANQLEKLEAAKPAYLWIPLDTFGYLWLPLLT